MGSVMSLCRGSLAPPFLPEDMLVEIFLRLPQHPACLRRVSLTCKQFRRIVADGWFQREFRARHGAAPPLVGFFHNHGAPRFLPTDGAVRDGAAWDRIPSWTIVSVRHGRLLLQSPNRLRLLVLEPTSGRTHYLRAPPDYDGADHSTAAVLCASDRAAHEDCCAAPFRVAFVSYCQRHHETAVSVYCSRAGAWSTVAYGELSCAPDTRPAVLAGNVLYVSLLVHGVLAVDLGTHELSEVAPPMSMYDSELHGNVHIVASAGELRLAVIKGFILQFWARRTHWQLIRVVRLDILLPVLKGTPPSTADGPAFFLMGFDEDAGAAFIWTELGVFALNLDTLDFEKVLEDCMRMRIVYPYKSFFLPEGITVEEACGAMTRNKGAVCDQKFQSATTTDGTPSSSIYFDSYLSF